MLKGTEPLGANTVFVMSLDPVVPRTEYDLIRLVQESFPADIDARNVTAMFDALRGQSIATRIMQYEQFLRAHPDSRFAQEAMSKLELVAYLNTTLNTTHASGRAKETLILPVLARDEEERAGAKHPREGEASFRVGIREPRENDDNGDRPRRAGLHEPTTLLGIEGRIEPRAGAAVRYRPASKIARGLRTSIWSS